MDRPDSAFDLTDPPQSPATTFPGDTDDDGGGTCPPVAPIATPIAGDLLSRILPRPDLLADLAAAQVISHAAAARLALLYYLRMSVSRKRPCCASVTKIASRLRIPRRTVEEALQSWNCVTRSGRNGQRSRPWVYTQPTPTENPPRTPTENPPPHKSHRRETHVARKLPYSVAAAAMISRHAAGLDSGPRTPEERLASATETCRTPPKPSRTVGGTALMDDDET